MRVSLPAARTHTRPEHVSSEAAARARVCACVRACDDVGRPRSAISWLSVGDSQSARCVVPAINRTTYFSPRRQDPSQNYGWRTGAVVPELEQELEVQDTPRYQVTIRRLRAVEALISEWQSEQDPLCTEILATWQAERAELRTTAKRLLNPQFGSLFRTFHSQTYYSQRLSLYANIYTSSVANLLRFVPDHVFYPRRARLPHEVV